ncbi:MAG: hypothetical protein IKW96_08730 [Ruminococcus sp.]|uniref:hypothetical protein n=1 Tax=Ruminococcus sp. TaxID=41978 RepID=UPI0025D4F4C9|nr:hypothetical protein [Ruminococcus sp.]MBR5683340.1 hypothetical protein [Ruminococcus sp.]
MKKVIATLTFIAALILAGCGNVTPSADVEPVTTTQAAKVKVEDTTSADKMKLIGDKATGSSVFTITVDNKTGKSIKGFSVKSGSEEKFPSNMLQENDPFIKNERRMLYYVPVNSEGYAIGNSDAIANEEYLIKIDFSDDKSAILHQFPFGDLEGCELLLDKEVAYIEYTSKLSDQKVSTKEAENMIASLEAEQEPTTEKPKATEPVYTQPVYEEPVYTQPATTQYVAPTTVYTEPTTVYVEPTTQAPAPTEPVTEAPTSPDGGCVAGQGGGALTW